MIELHNAECFDKLRELEDNSVDSVVTDPPYFLSFMGKDWDKLDGNIAANVEFWKEVLRVLKPGGHLLAFGHSRTHHRLYIAIEDAGFEIRDTIMWLYSTGFPKSHNISKAIDKELELCYTQIKELFVNETKTSEQEAELFMRLMRQGYLQKSEYAETQQGKVLLSFLSQQGLSYEEDREALFLSKGKTEPCLEEWNNFEASEGKLQGSSLCKMSGRVEDDGEERRLCNGTSFSYGDNDTKTSITNGGSTSHRSRPIKQQRKELDVVSLQQRAQTLRKSKQSVEGWGTALKPAYEPICLARKPLEGTVATNVLKHGVGGLNIDESRVGTETISTHNAPKGTFAGGEQDRGSDTSSYQTHEGRWPANIILDEEAGEVLDSQAPKTGSLFKATRKVKTSGGSGDSWTNGGKEIGEDNGLYDGLAGASRFFYCAKVSKSERNAGCEEITAKASDLNSGGLGRKTSVAKRKDTNGVNAPTMNNRHPCVKPKALMSYLIKLITPPGGKVLDPFMGSGSTGLAAKEEGFSFIGIEREPEYFEIAKARIGE